MIFFIPFLLLAVIVGLWWSRRGSTLTRDCRWREDRAHATATERVFRCAACGAETRVPAGREPRDCLRAQTP
ncbi:hypothetical protein CG51_13795 [Haematobacter missouriensis]|uniref:hypothetical protein n=1 Tax=Haematobacter missouriensis TaxID=366616 RepID=UPI0004E8CE79|nr:hypothetical protein [Haematobacter missouriensis]KFI33365.1 hypothetical protein CG51_13795 [Haematobacter missouriensis]